MPGKTLLILLQGVDWQTAHRQIDRGRAPALKRMAEAGTSAEVAMPHANRIATYGTMMTGRPPHEHGVLTETEVRPDGAGVQRLSAGSWQRRPIWETAAAAGLRTIVVGMPATAPATRWDGTCVDDRFAEPPPHGSEDWPLPPRCANPTALRTTLRDMRLHPDELARTDLQGLPAGPAARAITTQAVALHLMQAEEWDLACVNLDLGVDAARTDAGMILMDACVSVLTQAAGPGCDVIVASPDGLFVATGRGFAADGIDHGMTARGVAGAALRSLGVAATRDAGTSDELRTEPTATTEAKAGPVAAVMLRQAAERAASWFAAGRYDKVVAEMSGHPDDVAGSLPLSVMVAQSCFMVQDWAGCRRLAASIEAIDPQNRWKDLILGAALVGSGERDAGEPYLRRAADGGRDDAEIVSRVAEMRMRMGHAAEAERLFRRAAELRPGEAPLLCGLAAAMMNQGRLADAERTLTAALGVRYDEPRVHMMLARLYATRRDWTKARGSIATAAAQMPDGASAEATELLRAIDERRRAA